MTLLHYIVYVVETVFPHISTFYDDLQLEGATTGNVTEIYAVTYSLSIYSYKPAGMLLMLSWGGGIWFINLMLVCMYSCTTSHDLSNT